MIYECNYKTNTIILPSGSHTHPLNMEKPQHEYLSNSPLSNFMNNSYNVWGKEGSEDLLAKSIMLSAVDHGYKPAAT